MEAASTLLMRPAIDDVKLCVAVVVETYPPEINGVALTAQRLVNALLDRGHSVHLIHPRQSAATQSLSAGKLTETLVFGIPIPRYSELRFGRPAVGLLKKLWLQHRPDVVHVMTEGPLGWSALRAASARGIPVTSGFHTNFHQYSKDYGLSWLGGMVGRYLRQFHNRTATTMVASPSVASELQTAGYRNLKLVGRGVDTTLFNPAQRNESLRQHWGVKADELVLLYVGRIAPEKNIDLALRTYQAMQLVRPVRMVIVGDGPQRNELQKRYPDCIFTGKQLGAALAAHYASADVFVFPSLSETFGNVTIEAMASGLAVLAFDYAAAKEYIVHKHNGLTATFADQAQFIRHGEAIATDPGSVKVLGRQACATAKKISWQAVFDQFERALLQAAGKSGE